MSTTINTPLPTRHRIRQLIEEMLNIEVGIADGIAAPARSTNLVGVYVTPKLATTALVITDLEAAARLGGALAEVPRNAVQEAIASRELTPVLSRNFYTLLDNMAKLFNGENQPEISLYEMYGADSVIPADVAALAGSAGSRIDLKLAVEGYGLGQMSLITR
ncbi:hypothetical protein ACIB24_02315 [Spongisporangium articulatum]|uniref:Uncharacterized protein n=1 Tax=Spongisporangium articulatum TaxID=3362603 RepID=A0ABW8AIU5_9ACTN